MYHYDIRTVAVITSNAVRFLTEAYNHMRDEHGKDLYAQSALIALSFDMVRMQVITDPEESAEFHRMWEERNGDFYEPSDLEGLDSGTAVRLFFILNDEFFRYARSAGEPHFNGLYVSRSGDFAYKLDLGPDFSKLYGAYLEERRADCETDAVTLVNRVDEQLDTTGETAE